MTVHDPTDRACDCPDCMEACTRAIQADRILRAREQEAKDQP